MFRVPISALAHGQHTAVDQPSAEDVGLDPEVFANVEVTVALDIGHNRVLADFDATATARLTCDRTLDPFDQPIEGRHTILFIAPEMAPEDGESDSLRVLPVDATEIDLTDAVRDTLLLAVPLRAVSPQAEAAALRTTFGAPADADEDQIDHWAALRALRPEGDAGDTTD